MRAMMGKADQTPGCSRRLHRCSRPSTPQLYLRHRPHQGADARHPHRPDVLGRAADLPRLDLRQRLQPPSAAPSASPRRRTARSALDPKGHRARSGVRNAQGETVPLGSFTTVSNISGPYRVPRYNLLSPRLSWMAGRRRATSQARPSTIMQKIAAETLPPGFSYEWTTLAFPADAAPAIRRVFAFALARRVRVPRARGTV